MYNKMSRVDGFKKINAPNVERLSELQNVQRFSATALSCSYWTDEPRKMLNVLLALDRHIRNSSSSNNNHKKFCSLRDNLKQRSFRMLIVAMSVIGKCIQIPMIRSGLRNSVYLGIFLSEIERMLRWHSKLRAWSVAHLETKSVVELKRVIEAVIIELETKPASTCKMPKCSAELSDPSEHSVCCACQRKHRINARIPALIVNLTGPSIGEQLHAFKYHKYLWADCDQQWSDSDLDFLQSEQKESSEHGHKYSKPVRAIPIHEILQQERKATGGANLDADPATYFHIILLAVLQRFVVLALEKFNALFGFSLLPLLLIDAERGAAIARVMVGFDKAEYLALAAKHIGDTGAKYGGTLKAENMQALVNEDIYHGPLKIYADCERARA